MEATGLAGDEEIPGIHSRGYALFLADNPRPCFYRQNNDFVPRAVNSSCRMGNILNNTVYKNRHFKRQHVLFAPEREPVQSLLRAVHRTLPGGFSVTGADYTRRRTLDLNA